MSTLPTYWRAMSHFGRFVVSGKDAAPLLHHLTTNDIKKLKSGEGCDAILISNKARVLDWLQVWRDGETYEVLTSPNRRDSFISHAKQFILFRQDVTIEDVSTRGALVGLFGDNLSGVLASWKIENLLDAPMNARREVEIGNVKFKIARTRRLPGDGVLIECDDEKSLHHLVTESGACECDNQTFNVLRIEAGLPVTGLELTEEINPWEANLDFAISLDKGCYNGQEIIARLNTYQKIKQRLMGLKLSTPLEIGEEKITLQSDGKNAGFITSSALSPNFGAIALAYIRNDFQGEDRALQVLGEDQAAIVTNLPF